MTTAEKPKKRHRYDIVIPGNPPYKADVFAVNPVMDLQFAWEEEDGATRLALVRYPNNVVIIDQECTESVEDLKNSLEQFRTNMEKANEDAVQNAMKKAKLPSYQ